MEKKESIRVGIMNEYDPQKGTVIIPEADFIYAVVHTKGSVGTKVICQSLTDIKTAVCCLMSALDGIGNTVKEQDSKFQKLFMAAQLGSLADMLGGKDDEDSEEEVDEE